MEVRHGRPGGRRKNLEEGGEDAPTNTNRRSGSISHDRMEQRLWRNGGAAATEPREVIANTCGQPDISVASWPARPRSRLSLSLSCCRRVVFVRLPRQIWPTLLRHYGALPKRPFRSDRFMIRCSGVAVALGRRAFRFLRIAD